MALLVFAVGVTALYGQFAQTNLFTGVNLSIPDGNASGVEDIRSVDSDIAQITSVRVRLKVTGHFNGDLYGYVRHSSGTTTRISVLLNRPGRTTADIYGYSGSGFDVTFADSAANDIHTYRPVTNPPAGDLLQPDARFVDPAVVTTTSPRTVFLSEFEGMSAGGEWTLFLADMEGGGTNFLNSWGLEITGKVMPKTITGTVRYYASVQSVAGVTVNLVNLTEDTNLSALTLGDGSYSLTNVPAGGTYGVTPGKTNDSPTANGVDSFDQFLIQRHILGRTSLGSPYKLLAADVDGSGGIDSFDQFLIQRLILGRSSRFPLGLWRFVPADYVFPDTNNPWTAPTNRWYTNVLTDVPGQDLVAIKLGDVDNSWVVPAGGSGLAAGRASLASRAAAVEPELWFQMGSQNARRGDRVRVGVSVSGFRQVTSAQFTLAWDPTVLRYVGSGGYGLRGLSAGNLGPAMAAEGKLIFAWYDPGAEGVTVADGTAIFSVDFEVVGKVGSATALVLGDSPTVREASVNATRVTLGTREGSVSVGAADTVRVGEVFYQKGVFRLSVPTETGQRYVLEFTEGLPATNWTALPPLDGDGTVQALTDPSPTNAHRFYRVRVE